LNNYNYIYLHGFTSSPRSPKANFFRSKLNALGLNVTIPDLNLPEFCNLTLTRQVNQVNQLIQDSAKPVVLIGSSLGALVSSIVSNNPKVFRVILLAPAFGIDQVFVNDYGIEKLQEWKKTNNIEVDHYTYKKPCILHYKFYSDLNNYSILKPSIKNPCIIFHGVKDEVIPIQNSRNVVAVNPAAELVELDSDHSLENVLEQIWVKTEQFLHDNILNKHKTHW